MNKLVLRYDSYVDSPRENCDNLTTLALKSCVCDEEIRGDVNEWLMEMLGDKDIQFYENAHGCHFYTNEMQGHLLDRLSHDYIWLPVYKYKHSDVVFNTTGFSCRWDSGQCGIIYVSKADLYKEYNTKRISPKLREKVLDMMRSEVEEYSAWANGEVVSFCIEDEEGDVLDSCGGFIMCGEWWDSVAEYIDRGLLGGISQAELIELIKNTDIESSY